MASLIEMPELVMENIIWFSDFRAVLTLRQVCRDFRRIDDLNDSKLPDSNFHTENSEFPSDSLIHTLPIKMNNMVKKLNRKIKTKSLSVATVTPFGIMSILPFIDPEPLDSLRCYPRYRNMEMEIREIVKTEQWKKAKEFYYHCEFNPSRMKSRMKSRIEEVTRFSKVIMQGLSVTPRDLIFLKKIIIYSVTEDWPFVISGRLEREENEFSTWPPAFVSESTNHWYFGIGNTWELFLEITTGKSSEKTEIGFKIIRSEDVPDEAIIQG
ncbi:unnamed protein product [Caenorhabditis nigoni]